MEELNFLEQIKIHSESENILAASRDVNELRTKFEDYILEEERKVQVTELEAKDTPETESAALEVTKAKTAEITQLKDEFYEIYQVYKEKKRVIIDEKNSTETKNLGEKMTLINRLREVVSSEENIGAAFGSLKEIQEKWKEIGDIPRDKRDEIQKQYSHLLDDFFYNIKIYKELKDHDFHRNAQLKKNLIEQLKELSKKDKIKEVEAQLKELQNEWNDVGPVPNEEWELLKEAYWTEVRSIYNKVNRFYDDRRVKLQANLESKKNLLEQTKELVAQKEELNSPKTWEAVTKKVIAIQNEWKAVGFGPKKENDAIWKEFRACCDDFFDKKKIFFGDVQEVYDKIAVKKKEIIEKAKALSTSTEWRDTAEKLKKLQSQWKSVGHAGVKHEQKLWKEFRNACDAFFNSRENHFNAKDAQNDENLKLKETLLKTLEAYKPSEDKKEALADLKNFSAEFSAIGHVPIKKKDAIFSAYKKTMDGHYQSIKLSKAEQESIFFEAKIDMLKGSPNASRQFNDMKFDLRKAIDKHQKEISQLENNLGFFANSKGADALKKDVENKVNLVKEKIEVIKRQLKMIPNE